MQQLTFSRYQSDYSSDYRICPRCDEQFGSKKSTNLHYTQTHDGDLFSDRMEQRYGVPGEWLLHTLYELLDYSLDRIAGVVGYSVPAVEKKLRQYGVSNAHPCPVGSCDYRGSTRSALGSHHGHSHPNALMYDEIRTRFNQDPREFLITQYHHRERSLDNILSDLNGSRPALLRLFDALDISTRSLSEARNLSWEQTSEAQKEARSRRAKEQIEAQIADGRHPMAVYMDENPEDAREHFLHISELSQEAQQQRYRTRLLDADDSSDSNPSPLRLYMAVEDALDDLSGGGTKEQARKDADYRCEMCDTPQSAFSRALDVNHIVPVLAGGTNGDWNMMALCRSCHAKVDHFIRDYVEPSLLSREYHSR